jgi:hypothetical protein
VTQVFAGSVHEAQTCWCQVGRWPEWVDGLARIVAVQGDWPQVGSSVIWESGPAGRGRVTERVSEYEALAGLTLAVRDDSLTGRQRVAFDPVDRGVQVELTLDYRLKRRTPWTAVVEWLFVRRPMAISLTKTLERFGGVLETSRASGLG